jgi:hypothetical protein
MRSHCATSSEIAANVIAACNQTDDNQNQNTDDPQSAATETSSTGGTAPIFHIAT